MIKVAILEHERETKEIAFALSNYFSTLDWTFRHFYKASELVKAMKEESYQIFFFDEVFQTPRFESVFVHDNPSSLIVYLCQDPKAKEAKETRRRVIYISKSALKSELVRIEKELMAQANQQECYSLVYQGVRIDIPIENIYYLEKIGKNVYFHTTKGEFYRRLSLNDLEAIFDKYGFLRVHLSYLINATYLTGVYKDEVELAHKLRVPLSRLQKQKLGLRVRHPKKTKNTPPSSSLTQEEKSEEKAN